MLARHTSCSRSHAKADGRCRWIRCPFSESTDERSKGETDPLGPEIGEKKGTYVRSLISLEKGLLGGAQSQLSLGAPPGRDPRPPAARQSGCRQWGGWSSISSVWRA